MLEALTPLDRISCIKMYKNNARSRLFCSIAKRSIAKSDIFGSKLSDILAKIFWDRKHSQSYISGFCRDNAGLSLHCFRSFVFVYR